MGQVNDIKSLETKILHLKEELRQKELEAENLKGAFLANISHEIRTPMNAIVGFSSLLRDNDISPEDQKDFLNEIINSAHHLTGLLDDIIEVATLQFASKKELKNEVIDVEELLQDLLDEYHYKRDSLYKAGIEMELNIVSTPKQSFESNKRIVHKVLSNLIDNSLKFTSKGRIKIELKAFDDYLQFAVKDTGIGIPKEKLNLIFTNFSRVWKNEGQVLYDGLGIGLSTAKNLVELLKGELIVESTEGKGTSVFLNIPYTTSESSSS
ncbi:MAG: HAMP domain-containing histidine kinase [Bacteroidales bacterium]|nr:HAMP domain-containing histidine kinase [Bacteroidales bacterium]